MKVLRWLLVPLAAGGGFAASLIPVTVLNRLIHDSLWQQGHFMPGKVFMEYVLPYDGAVAAAFFITFGWLAAPSHRFRTAIALFGMGAALAWFLVGDIQSPIRSAVPQRLWAPFLGTLIGGAVTLLILGCVTLLYRGRKFASVAGQ